MGNKLPSLVCILIFFTLFGLECMVQNNDHNFVIEYRKIDDVDSFCCLAEQLLPIHAEAFTDEIRDFMLDSNFQVKPEYQTVFEEMCKDKNKKEFYNEMLAFTIYPDRQKRVEMALENNKRKLKELSHKMLQQKPVVFIAMGKDANILGFALFLFECPNITNNAVELALLAVDPKVHKQGIGRALIFSIFEKSPETKRILLNTTIWNTRAQIVYTNLGFKKIDSNEPEIIRFEYTLKSDTRW